MCYALRKFVMVTSTFVLSGENQEEDRYRRPTRAKPIMIPVDQPPPPRERKSFFACCVKVSKRKHRYLQVWVLYCSLLQTRVWLFFFQAIATAVPNGHLMGNDVLPMRPLYPRTQYTNNIPLHQYSSTPRVNAADLSQPSSGMLDTPRAFNLQFPTSCFLPFQDVVFWWSNHGFCKRVPVRLGFPLLFYVQFQVKCTFVLNNFSWLLPSSTVWTFRRRSELWFCFELEVMHKSSLLLRCICTDKNQLCPWTVNCVVHSGCRDLCPLCL